MLICYFTFVVVDSNGQSEVVGYCILTSEDLETVTHMASVFKQHNPRWTEIKCIMADKDFTERNVFREQFPQSKILICIFHCMRSFSREITVEKMKITTGFHFKYYVQFSMHFTFVLLF